MKYNILTPDRKDVVKKLEELTGKKPAYAGAPSFAYSVDGITVNRDKTVTTEEDADESIIQQLVDAGMLESSEAPEEAPTSAEEAETEETPEEANETPEEAAQGAQPEEKEPAEASETETTEEVETEESDSEEVETEITEESDSEEPEQETADAPEDEAGEAVQEPEGPKPTKIEVSFPLEKHSAESITNLIATIYSKGDLLSKSTGGDFFISEALMDKVKAGALVKKEDALTILKDASTGDLRGLSFTDEKVTFDGFPETEDPDVLRAWTKLAAAINEFCIGAKRVQAKRNEETNEKFAFRTWLTRIGMNGPALKADRQIYYRNLTGHTAFRTPADAERWKVLQAERVARRKAAEAAALEDEKAETPAEEKTPDENSEAATPETPETEETPAEAETA